MRMLFASERLAVRTAMRSWGVAAVPEVDEQFIRGNRQPRRLGGSPYFGMAASLRRRYATGSNLPSMMNGSHSASASACS